ncbi:MAG: response regulator [Nibricoccus sp.]
MNTEKILFVDDDPNVLAAIQRNLRKRFTLDFAASGTEALEMVRTQGPYAVIVADMSMPVMNGVDLLVAVRSSAPDTIRIMLTGNADQQTAVEAVNRGNVFRFLAKPCSPETLSAILDTALKQHELVVVEKMLLSKTLNGSLQVLTDILAVLDPEAFGQAQQRRSVAREIAFSLGMESTWDVEIAALLAEIGIVTLPSVVREKIKTNQDLAPKERQLAERVPEFSSRLLASIPRLDGVAQAVLYQNKNFDGSGFPHENISCEGIPLAARVLRVATEVVKMHNKSALISDIVQALKAGPERYDPTVVRAISASFAGFNPKASGGSGMRSVSLAELAAGDVLLSNVATADGSVVVCVGTTLSDTQLQRLRNFALLHPIAEPITVDTRWSAKPGSGENIVRVATPKTL